MIDEDLTTKMFPFYQITSYKLITTNFSSRRHTPTHLLHILHNEETELILNVVKNAFILILEIAPGNQLGK